MLLKVGDLVGCNLLARDEKAGSVREFYFNDQSWRVKYLVGDLGHRLPVLIPVDALGRVRLADRSLELRMSRAELETCSSINTDLPVCRQFALKHYSGCPASSGAAGRRSDPHLRSSRALIGYAIQSDHVSHGVLEDFVLDDETWEIRALVTQDESLDKPVKTQLRPGQVTSISWGAATIYVDYIPPVAPKFIVAAAA